ncbi:hypothetical protein GCM10010350_74460 [Streptomyces galilaeus]|nr:hypothetical protein GCM10010350_74460 [Streptomyces galilaeus]
MPQREHGLAGYSSSGLTPIGRGPRSCEGALVHISAPGRAPALTPCGELRVRRMAWHVDRAMHWGREPSGAVPTPGRRGVPVPVLRRRQVAAVRAVEGRERWH